MRARGVPDEAGRNRLHADLCREIGFSKFQFLLDPTLAVISVYGINLATQEPWGDPGGGAC